MFTHYGYGHHYQPITSAGITSITARHVTNQTCVLAANRKQFFRALTFEQRVAKAQAQRIESARSTNEHTTSLGIVIANGGEW